MSSDEAKKEGDKRYPASDPQLPQPENEETNRQTDPLAPSNVVDALSKGATGDVIEKSGPHKSDEATFSDPDVGGEKELGLHRCLGFHDIGQTIAGKSDDL